MGKIFKHRFKEIIDFIDIILPNLKMVEEKGDTEFIEVMLKYIFETGRKSKKEEVLAVLKNNLSEKTGAKMITIADAWRQEGLQEGMNKGKLEGKLEGLQEAMLKIASSMLREREPIEKIIRLTNLSRNEIEKLTNQQH